MLAQATTADIRESSPKQSGIRSLLRFWPFIAPDKWRFFASIVASLMSTLSGLAIPLITQRIIDGPIAHGRLTALWGPVILVFVLGSIDALGIWTRRAIVARPSSKLEVTLRAKLFAKLQSLSVGIHNGWDSGQLLSRAVQDMSTLRRFAAFAAPFLVINTVTIGVGIILMLFLSWPLGLVVVVCSVPVLFICKDFQQKYRIVSRQAQDQTGDAATIVEESVQGIRILKAFGRSGHLGRRFLKQVATLRGTELKKVHNEATLWALVSGIPAVAIGLILAIGTWAITADFMTPGTVVAAITMSTFLQWPTISLGFLLAELNNAGTAADRYFEIIDTPVAIENPARPVKLPEPVTGELSFANVTFFFDDADRPVLHDVRLTIDPGETVALVGTTGSGKTTLTTLVPRLYDVTGGAITIDGVDIRSLDLNELRSIVTVAFEEPILFSASVRENVALGMPAATDDQVHRALDLAQAGDFVANLPWGLDTRVGEQGLSLSGGQRQRLALARAVLGSPRIMVLDDPLSALDVGTEEKVQAGLKSVLEASTTLLVAHRPSTAALADRVALLDGGTITDEGTHEELLRTSARYRYVMGSSHV